MQVNEFLARGTGRKAVSVSDTTTTDQGGTIGIIRVLTYDE